MTTTESHGTWIGTRTIRTNEGAHEGMPFARCICGWEGPGRDKRSTAVRDGLDHLDAHPREVTP